MTTKLADDGIVKELIVGTPDEFETLAENARRRARKLQLIFRTINAILSLGLGFSTMLAAFQLGREGNAPWTMLLFLLFGVIVLIPLSSGYFVILARRADDLTAIYTTARRFRLSYLAEPPREDGAPLIQPTLGPLDTVKPGRWLLQGTVDGSELALVDFVVTTPPKNSDEGPSSFNRIAVVFEQPIAQLPDLEFAPTLMRKLAAVFTTNTPTPPGVPEAVASFVTANGLQIRGRERRLVVLRGYDDLPGEKSARLIKDALTVRSLLLQHLPT